MCCYFFDLDYSDFESDRDGDSDGDSDSDGDGDGNGRGSLLFALLRLQIPHKFFVSHNCQPIKLKHVIFHIRISLTFMNVTKNY